MKLQFDHREQKSEPVARVSVDVVDDELIKVMINGEDVINIWGTSCKRGPYIYVYKRVANELGFNLEVS